MKLSPESSAIIMRMVARRREKLKQSQQDSQQSDKPLPEIQALTLVIPREPMKPLKLRKGACFWKIPENPYTFTESMLN